MREVGVSTIGPPVKDAGGGPSGFLLKLFFVIGACAAEAGEKSAAIDESNTAAVWVIVPGFIRANAVCSEGRSEAKSLPIADSARAQATRVD